MHTWIQFQLLPRGDSQYLQRCNNIKFTFEIIGRPSSLGNVNLTPHDSARNMSVVTYMWSEEICTMYNSEYSIKLMCKIYYISYVSYSYNVDVYWRYNAKRVNVLYQQKLFLEWLRENLRVINWIAFISDSNMTRASHVFDDKKQTIFGHSLLKYWFCVKKGTFDHNHEKI